MALLNATIRPGIELILELIDFDHRVVGADLVVTGEGSLDDQSLAGKAPIGVARAAARSGVPVVAIAGRLLLSPQQLRKAGISAAYPLTDLEPDLDRCIAEASSLLQQIGAQIARDWLPKAVSGHEQHAVKPIPCGYRPLCVVTLVSVVFWAWVLGPIGAILAVPLTLLVKALIIDSDPRAAWAEALIGPTRSRRRRRRQRNA